MELRFADTTQVNEGDTGSFRRLLEDEISTDEYVERLDQRVRERQEAEETQRREPPSESDT
jgi:hypothetical protein